MIKKLKTQGIEIEYLVKGDGPPLLFVHGAMASFRFYSRTIDLLSKRFKVYAPTLPGMGKSGSLGRKVKFESYTKAVSDLISMEKIKPVAIGHSLGGAVISALAASNTKMLKSIVLVNSAGLPYDNFLFRTLYGWFGGYKEFLRWNQEKGIVSKIIPWDIRNMVFRRTLDSIYLGRVLKRIDLKDEYSKIVVPTLIIWGEGDTHIPLRLGRRIKELIKDAKLETIKDAEHNWIGYRPEVLLKKLQQFLS
ncbi:MAG: alpha/beta fold hydrolase [Candidatus Dojkabacteria bacterium]